jgi:chaperone BCS1
MTTNHPEKLDEALIRPGRVDHQVAFSHASQTQIKELFERMYANDLPKTILLNSSSAAKFPFSTKPPLTKSKVDGELTPPLTPTTTTSCSKEKTAVGGTMLNKEIEDVQGEELRSIARAFARKVPDGMFSPAEIQGFLLKRKKDPRKAEAEVGKWVEGMVEQKSRGSKLRND